MRHRTLIFRSMCGPLIRTMATSAGQAVHVTSKPMKLWEVYVSVFLERPPIISPSLSPLEERFQNFVEEMEAEQGLYNDYELKVLGRVSDDSLERELENEKGTSRRAENLKDMIARWEEEYQDFQRSTPAPQPKDSRKLALLKRTQLRDGKTWWLLPQTLLEDGETLVSASHRLLSETFDLKEGRDYRLLGRAPLACVKANYPASTGGEFEGGKIFIMKALANRGLVPTYSDSEKEKVGEEGDHMWCNFEELEEKLRTGSSRYWKVVSKLLLE